MPKNAPKHLTKRAAKMLLKGATLLGEPCPYCKGVRVMHDGNALCVGCGREPQERPAATKGGTGTAAPKDMGEEAAAGSGRGTAIAILEKKLASLSADLEAETDHARQRDILGSIDMLVETIRKMKG